MAKFLKVANLNNRLATLVARGKMSASLGVGSPKQPSNPSSDNFLTTLLKSHRLECGRFKFSLALLVGGCHKPIIGSALMGGPDAAILFHCASR